MDPSPQNLSPTSPPPEPTLRPVRRRRVLRAALAGVGGACLAGGAGVYFTRRVRHSAADVCEVFKNDAPTGELWRQWQARGWAQEAKHYLRLGRNVQCKLCPNDCLLEPGDRGRCRNRVNVDSTLYTLGFADPCSLQIDPIEKKPLYHFLPASRTFSMAVSGCGFRCLNCQNWSISQRKPEEMKDPRGQAFLIRRDSIETMAQADLDRGTLLPGDAVELARQARCRSIAYTYTEPTSWFEYMTATAAAARKQSLANVWVTCGYISTAALDELCSNLDAANVDLKSFSDEIYGRLNGGKLQPILDCLVQLKRRGVWTEVTNLVVPTYCDDLEMIRRMCGWLVENLGPDCPLHFSRFHPAHRLKHLPQTPADILVRARQVALAAGLHYVYVGNLREIDDSHTTFCPSCKKPVVRREGYTILSNEIEGGKCKHCKTPIAGRWT